MITKDHKTRSLLTKISQCISMQVDQGSVLYERYIQNGLYFSYSTDWSHRAQLGAVGLIQHSVPPTKNAMNLKLVHDSYVDTFQGYTNTLK